MPVSYLNDLRWCIIWQHVFLRSPADEVAQTFFVNERTVLRYAERFHATGQVEQSVRHNGCCSKLSDSDSDKYLLLTLSYLTLGYIQESCKQNYKK